MKLNRDRLPWNWALNPIIVKELRSRMRGMRAFATLTGILLLIGAVSFALYRMVLVTSRYSNTPLSPLIGGTLFAGLAILELIMICGVTPAVTAGEISGELEKQTYEMLLATPLRPASILWGKLVSSLSYVFILIFAAIPMASLVFIFGGVALRDMFKALIVMVSVAVFLGALGLFMSALFKRTGRATALTYLVVILLLLGPIFTAIAVGILGSTTPPRWILVPSPISALTSAIQPSASLEGPASLFFYLGGAMWGAFGTPISQTSIPRPIYHYSLPLYGGLALILYLLATRLVQPTRRWRLSWKEATTGTVLILGFAGLVAGAFLVTAGRYERGGLFRSQIPSQPQPVVVERIVPAVEVQPAVPVDLPAEEPVEEGGAGVIKTPDQIPPTPTPVRPPGALFSIEERAQIYAAVIEELILAVQGDSRDGRRIESLWIARTTSDQAARPNVPQSDPTTIPAGLQAEIQAALSLPDIEVSWVEAEESMPPDTGSPAVYGTALLVLGNLHGDDNLNVIVSASIFLDESTSLERTYVLDNSSGKWGIRRSTGAE